MLCPEIICYERKWPECIQWNGREGQEGAWETRQRWENGDRPTATAEGATEQKLLFADADALVLFILGRGGRRPLLALSPRSLAPISVIIALAKAGHCPLYLSEKPNTSFGAKSWQNLADYVASYICPICSCTIDLSLSSISSRAKNPLFSACGVLNRLEKFCGRRRNPRHAAASLLAQSAERTANGGSVIKLEAGDINLNV